MDGRYTVSEIVASLYSAVLARSADQSELDFHVEAAAHITLEQLIAGIVSSPEASDQRRESFVRALTLPDTASRASESRMTVAADDVMNVVAAAHERLLGRRPTLTEVARRFKAIANGSSLQQEIDDIGESPEARSFDLKKQSPHEETRASFAEYIARVYLLCLKRSIVDDEIDGWYGSYLDGTSLPQVMRGVAESDEAKKLGRGLEAWDPGQFVQLVYEVVLGRGAMPREIENHRRAITTGGISRSTFLGSLFSQIARRTVDGTPASTNDCTQALLFGHSMLTTEKWKDRERELADEPVATVGRGTRFPFTSKASPLVSLLTSLYCGGAFIETFLENITTQTIFPDCELLIVDANSPEGEQDKAERYLKRFSNIRYMRHSSRVGIYEAWNMCVQEARGAYCTNANLDDCRRSDSLELQASTLDALPFVDIVYQDVLYSLSENMPFCEVEKYGFKTNLPIISRYNLLEFNSPHNAPMWRKTLHDEIGYFNADLKSAADFEFWIRCAAARKTFYKINDAHVAYYVNPEGLSTRSDTRGRAEADTITKTFNRLLISKHLIVEDELYANSLSAIVDGRADANSRYMMAQIALRRLSAASRGDADDTRIAAAVRS